MTFFVVVFVMYIATKGTLKAAKQYQCHVIWTKTDFPDLIKWNGNGATIQWTVRRWRFSPDTKQHHNQSESYWTKEIKFEFRFFSPVCSAIITILIDSNEWNALWEIILNIIHSHGRISRYQRWLIFCTKYTERERKAKKKNQTQLQLQANLVRNETDRRENE